jgi:Flp pilus assembly protein TadD
MGTDESGRNAWLEGNRRFRSGEFVSAFTAYTLAISENPGEADFYHNRGVTRLAMGDANGALEDLWRAIELFPDSADTLRLAGALHSARGRQAEAVRLVNHARSIDGSIRGETDQLFEGVARVIGRTTTNEAEPAFPPLPVRPAEAAAELASVLR